MAETAGRRGTVTWRTPSEPAEVRHQDGVRGCQGPAHAMRSVATPEQHPSMGCRWTPTAVWTTEMQADVCYTVIGAARAGGLVAGVVRLALLAAVASTIGLRRGRVGGGLPGGAAVGASGEQRRRRLHLQRVPDPLLLLHEVRADVEEGGRRLLGTQHGDRFTEFGVQPAQCVDDQGSVGDGGADVVQGVGEVLEAAAVLSDVKSWWNSCWA